MFLAIINDNYAEVKAEIEATYNAYEMTDYFRRGYNNILGRHLPNSYNFGTFALSEIRLFVVEDG
jgi:hypothetical protein